MQEYFHINKNAGDLPPYCWPDLQHDFSMPCREQGLPGCFEHPQLCHANAALSRKFSHARHKNLCDLSHGGDLRALTEDVVI